MTANTRHELLSKCQIMGPTRYSNCISYNVLVNLVCDTLSHNARNIVLVKEVILRNQIRNFSVIMQLMN